MKAVITTRFTGREGQSVHFDGDYGTRIILTVLEPTIFRVTMLRAEGWRLDRTWSIAPGGLEPPFEGRARDDLAGFSCPEFTIDEEPGRVIITSAALTAAVRLEPFGIAWHEAGNPLPFAQ